MAAQAPISMEPLPIGKFCTALQVVYIGWHLAALAFGFPTGSISPADAYLVGLVAFASGAVYWAVWFQAMRAVWFRDVRRV